MKKIQAFGVHAPPDGGWTRDPLAFRACIEASNESEQRFMLSYKHISRHACARNPSERPLPRGVLVDILEFINLLVLQVLSRADRPPNRPKYTHARTTIGAFIGKFPQPSAPSPPLSSNSSQSPP